MTRTRYLPDSTSPWLPIVVLPALMITGAWILVSQVAGHAGPGVPFMILWCAVALWNSYFWLIRVAYKIELQGSDLLWFAPLRRGRFHVAQLRAIERTPLSRQLVRFTTAEGASVIIRNHRDLSMLVADIMTVNPDVKIGEISPGGRSRAGGAASAYRTLPD